MTIKIDGKIIQIQLLPQEKSIKRWDFSLRFEYLAVWINLTIVTALRHFHLDWRELNDCDELLVNPIRILLAGSQFNKKGIPLLIIACYIFLIFYIFFMLRTNWEWINIKSGMCDHVFIFPTWRRRFKTT